MKNPFSWRRKRKARNLEDWLLVATRGLESSARGRISTEITAHFSESVSAYKADGKPESDAYSMALADLGNAYQAAKEFQKSHLTEREAKWLKKIENTASKATFASTTESDDVSFYFFLLASVQLSFTGLALGFPISIGERAIPRLLYVRRLSYSSFQSQLLFAKALIYVGWETLFVYCAPKWPTTFDMYGVFPMILLCYGLVIVNIGIYRSLRVWSKLRNKPEGPPNGTPVVPS
jgi:hypothetical protein